MFSNQRFGLGAPIDELERLMPEHNVKDVIDILTYVRLGRLGEGEERLFSFAHRRFNEYFVAKGFIEDKSIISIESIPTDSRWRDAMVMYCEIAPKEDVLKIAKFCWDNIDSTSFDTVITDRNNYLRSIHCLRFLKDAFRTRKDCLVDFIDDLNNLIRSKVENDDNIVTQKIVVESVLLLEENDIDAIVSKALSNQSSWVRDEAFRACRSLSEISQSLSNKLLQYVYYIDDVSLFKKFGEISFSLSLSSAFDKLRKLLFARMIFNYMFLVGCFISVLIKPVILVLYFSICFIVYFIFYFYISVKGDFSKIRSLVIKITIKLYGFLIVSLIMYETIVSQEDVQILFYQNMLGFDIVRFSAFLCILLMVPYFEFYALSVSARKMSLKKLGVAFIWLICGGILAYFMVMALDALALMVPESYKTFLISLLAILSCSSIFVPMLRNIYGMYQDHKSLKKFHLPREIKREQLCEHLDSFRTAWGQKIYLNHLDIDRVNFSGNWPICGFPKCKSDTNRSILAKIEERNLI